MSKTAPKPEGEFWARDHGRIEKLSAAEARATLSTLLDLLFPDDDLLDMGETMQVVEDLLHTKDLLQ